MKAIYFNLKVIDMRTQQGPKFEIRSFGIVSLYPRFFHGVFDTTVQK